MLWVLVLLCCSLLTLCAFLMKFFTFVSKSHHVQEIYITSDFCHLVEVIYFIKLYDLAAF